ncbi:Phox homologous domain-containing protein [Phialemonium atrogriseum]|uniref:Endosomal/vacuolar adapter protein YPT35 n=1 Tax=Phialemonium atrogriseum TaxID=1093897 RepID=A0AAJ0BV44_9PEZI|nr:Phox domain-containing protein [Phialemonium atrogriseum]KAK1764821.1 Phox homologous domain-containing protein [Phialemonium atrogriseum]
MASEVEHRPQAARKGGGNPGGVNDPPTTSRSSSRPSQPVAKSATGRVWALINGEGAAEPLEPAAAAAIARPLDGLQPLFADATDYASDSGDESSSPSDTLSPVSSPPPPYWAGTHARSVSNTSVESVLPVGAITLQDNEHDDGPGGSNVYGRDRNRACWAKSVEVTDFVVVNGSATNIGAFVVWNIRVETLNGSYMSICKRYSEFDDLRRRLMQTFPNFKAAMPELPPKSVISKFRPRFLERRRAGLQYFLNCILLNPEFSGSPVLKDFLFS